MHLPIKEVIVQIINVYFMRLQETELRFFYLAIDLIILNVTIGLMYFASPVLKQLDSHEMSLYFLLFNLSEFIAYSMLSRKNLYLHDSFTNRIKRISSRVLIFGISAFVLFSLYIESSLSLRFLLECITLLYISKVIFYFFLYTYLKIRRKNGLYVHKALIIGYNEMGFLLRDLLENNPMLGYVFVGFVADVSEEDKDHIGHINELKQLVEDNQIDFIFVTLSAYNDLKKSKELLAICNKIGVRLRFVPENQYWLRSSKNLESVGSLVVFNPQEIPLDGLKSRFMKRTFDIVFSSFVIVFVISWLFPILFVLIKLTSKGPVFFLQKRTGINNRTFKCLKFRSMTVSKDADEKQATKGDVRITRIGGFLRKTNLDEFPQFFNVLLGHMSIVGPRPHMLKHTDQYSELIDHYKVRHYIKPGITGWAQVNGYRGETDELWKMEKRVEYDMYYLENWNFLWDLRIIMDTVVSKKAHKNAY